MNTSENIRIATDSIRANWLRALLTLMIIAFGIMALVGILTAIDSINASLSNSLSMMGSNTFNIMRKGSGVHGRRRGRKEKAGDYISFDQAMEFKERFDYPALVSVSALGSTFGTVKYGKKKSNPNVLVTGCDENYLTVAGYDLSIGRNFTQTEVLNGQHVVLVGGDIVELLFDGNEEKAMNKAISVGNIRYTIVGVLASKGSSMAMSGDRQVFIPILNVRKYFGSQTNSYNISVNCQSAAQMDDAISEATGVFRGVRRLKLSEENDFVTSKSDSLFNLLLENTKTLRLATIFIGLITLLGAAIGLMNIMLVSVTERTREIGVRKALGATRNNILLQFLTEAVVICQIGGIVGVILGIGAGNLMSLITHTGFIVPWGWMAMGIIVCFVVGLISGIYPAIKASGLDPIESLRYE